MVRERSRSRLLPSLLRYRRRMKRRPQYVRLYGRYRTITGKIKGFSLQIKYRKGFNNKLLGRLIRHTIGKMKYERQLPVHIKGQTFGSFLKLFRSPWIKIRAVLDYDVKMIYD